MSQGNAATAEPGNGRLILALIAGIPVTVILAASWLWYFVVQGDLDIVGRLGTANAGELLQPPRQSLEASWVGREGNRYALNETPKWTLVVPHPAGPCAALCERRLYEVRQIHEALGKTMGRVQRAMVTTAAADDLDLAVDALSDERPLPESFYRYLERDQRGLDLWFSAEGDFAAMFPELGEHSDSWYLMDPAGWVMMRYDDSVSYKDVIADLKFLLKNSNG
jgi:hypothetical protein